mgnify:CR=1 FL=1
MRNNLDDLESHRNSRGFDNILLKHTSSVDRPFTGQIATAIEHNMKTIFADPLSTDLKMHHTDEDLDVSTRLKVFEDIIINRIKVI